MKNEVTLVTIKVDGTVEEKQIDVNNLTALQNAVGGYIEIVPMLTLFEHKGVIRECIALCDEEGKLKSKPVNQPATRQWLNMLNEKGIPGVPDALVGDIAFVYGDPAIMANF